MPLDPVNIGSSPNDGQGDALRTAFDKLNKNDAYLLTQAGAWTGAVSSEASARSQADADILANTADETTPDSNSSKFSTPADVVARAERATFIPSGVGALARTIRDKLRGWFHIDDYDTSANARAAAVNGVLIAAPTVNSAFAGAKTREGLISGHIRVGATANSEINAHVGMHVDETFADTGQEVRGATFTMRNYRTTPDEAMLGWDFFGVAGAAVVESANTQYIRGSMKGVIGEVYGLQPLSGSYKIKNAYALQSVTILGASGVTVEHWKGLAINAPTLTDFSSAAPLGSIEEAFGVHVGNITQGSTKRAAIKLDGTNTNGQVLWGKTSISEDSTGSLQLGLDTKPLKLLAPLTRNGVGSAGGAAALPATPSFYLAVLIGSTEYRIPVYAST